MSLDSNDVLKLETWSFLKDYRRRQAELRVLARAAFEFTQRLLGHAPSPDDCEELCSTLLIGSDVFRGMLARKRHLPPSFYKAMSVALAKYVIHTDWAVISI